VLALPSPGAVLLLLTRQASATPTFRGIAEQGRISPVALVASYGRIMELKRVYG